MFRALGEFREERAADALLKVVDNGDESYYAEAWATAAMGKTRDPRAFEALERSLNKDSQNEVIRASVFQGLGDLRDERGVGLALAWSAYGRPAMVRGSAASALAKLGDFVPENRKEEIVDHLIPLIDDPWFRSSMSAIDALEELKATKALPHLDRFAASGLDGRQVRSARLASEGDPGVRQQQRRREEAARGDGQANGREPDPEGPPGQDRGEANLASGGVRLGRRRSRDTESCQP